MNKRIRALLLALLAVSSFCACRPYPPTEEEPTKALTDTAETELGSIEQTQSDYVISTEWMTFCFSKKEFTESEAADIAAEAVFVMADVRNYLKVNYTSEEAQETVCYFDRTYRNKEGRAISMCYWTEKRMHCISLSDFVHEYVHMISENNEDLVYHPSKIFSEGLAQYVSLHFFDGIATRAYTYFTEAPVSTNSEEHQRVCKLLSKNGLAYTTENYNKAFVAILDKQYDVSKIDKDSDFYNYIIGQVFVDYCIRQLGGLEKFISVYCDCVTASDVYGKSVDDLVLEACAYNTAAFYGD